MKVRPVKLKIEIFQDFVQENYSDENRFLRKV